VASKTIIKTGKGENIVFLHGWMQTADSWSLTVEHLKNDYCCWALDLPGFGSCPRPESVWSPLDYAKWVSNIIKEHKISNPIIVGHSFGGRIAIVLAATNPEIKAIVLEGTPGLRPPMKLKNKVASALIRAIKRTGIPKENVPFYIQVSNKIQSDDYKLAGDLKPIFTATINFGLISYISKIKIPTLLIWGQNDTEVPISIGEAIHRLIKGSKLKVVPNASHFTHLEKPALFSGYIRNFIDGQNH